MINDSLSVILPNYNHSMFLEKTLDDMLAQSFQPKEIIVVDDGSTDNSVEIIEKIIEENSIVGLLQNKVNKGIFYSTNRALERCSGDYLYFAGADDLIYAGFFERSILLLSRFPDAGLCSSICESVEPNGVRIKPVTKDISLEECYIAPSECIKILHRRDSWMGGSTTIYRREAYFAVGGFNSELGPYCDTFLQKVVALKYGVCFIPDCMGGQRLYESSYSARDRSNVESYIKLCSKASDLMLREYKELFTVDFVNAWKTREIYLVKLSGLRRMQKQQLAVIQSFFKNISFTDRLVIFLVRLTTRVQFFTLCLYLLLRLGKEMRFVLKYGLGIAIRRFNAT